MATIAVLGRNKVTNDTTLYIWCYNAEQAQAIADKCNKGEKFCASAVAPQPEKYTYFVGETKTFETN